jgi:thymidylate kinase
MIDPAAGKGTARTVRPSGIGLPRRRRGGVIAVVGPDGAGKTTLCQSLLAGIFDGQRVEVFANRGGARSPSVLPHRVLRTRGAGPHSKPAYSPPLSAAKFLYLFVDHALSWVRDVRPFAQRSGWVIIERGWWDVIIDPLRYRMRPTPALGRWLARLMPKVDLMIVLEAPPEVIHARKQQLTLRELQRQRAAWRSVLPRRQRRVYLDASQDPATLLHRAEEEMRDVARAIGVPAGPQTGAAHGHDLTPHDRVEAPIDPSDRWLDLLRRIDRVAPGALVWKQVEPALGGEGDMDMFVPRTEWPVLAAVFREWAHDQLLVQPLACWHGAGTLTLVAADPSYRFLFEVDVKGRAAFRGTTLFRPEDLAPLVQRDERGFDRLRPGAEGLLKLFLHGVRRDGTLRRDRVARGRCADLIRQDPEGVRLGSLLFGPVAPLVRRLAELLATGTWDRRIMLRMDAWARRQALAHPELLRQRVRARLKRGCRGLKGELKDRDPDPGRTAEWMASMASDHPARTFRASEPADRPGASPHVDALPVAP